MPLDSRTNRASYVRGSKYGHNKNPTCDGHVDYASAELESDAGVALIERVRGRVALTAAGEVVVRGGKELLVRCSDLVQQVRGHQHGMTGEFRVAGQVGLPHHLAAAAIEGHMARFPGVRLRVLPVAAPLELLPDHADIAITFEPRPLRGPWLSTVLMRITERVVASRAYLDRHGTPRSVAELHQHVLMSRAPAGEDSGQWPLQTGDSVAVYLRFASADITLIRRCVLADMELARTPHSAGFVDLGSAPNTVVPVLPDVLSRELCIRAVMPDTLRMRGPFRML